MNNTEKVLIPEDKIKLIQSSGDIEDGDEWPLAKDRKATYDERRKMLIVSQKSDGEWQPVGEVHVSRVSGRQR